VFSARNHPRTGLTPPPARLRGMHVLVRAGALRLLLPQRAVGPARAFESRPRRSAEPGVFLLDDGHEQRRVVALSDELRPLSEFPDDRFVLTSLEGAGGRWFAWTETRVMIGADLAWRPLPPVMRTPQTPIEGWAALGHGGLAFVAEPQRLAGHVLAAGR